MTETTLPKLLVSKEEARQQIEAQIEKGQQLHAQQINSDDQLTEARRESRKWSDYNKTLLLRLFDNESIAEDAYTDFNAIRPILLTSSGPTPLSDELRRYQNTMSSSINSLESIRDRLKLYEPSETSQSASVNERVSDVPQSTFGDKVFIVHGRDDGAKETVARFIESLGIEATILHEQPSGGRTIIEKLERYSNEACFAIVLITPDDVGSLRNEADAEGNPRARQNVVFELGYFMGKLGRERVCPLFKGEVENPSDIDGIVYVTMDDAGAWRQQLRQEMKYAELPVQNR